MVFTQEMSLRTLAEEYLGNPNEWETLLHYNGFQSVADLRPDTPLEIPVALFQRTMQVLQQTAETAQRANMEGAGVLATTLIDEANRLYEQAADLKNRGDLETAETTAREALQWAENALTEARDKKIQAVSAILDQKEGMVQSRTPEEPVWGDTALKDELIEQERVRTLAESLAGILFVDESRISLSENSLAVIGIMKENLIKRSFQAEVTVLEGDILAHLSALGVQKEFTINTPGVETTIRSQKFRTTRDDEQTTRIANYDGEIDVEANQRMVTLKKNEGTKIEQGKPPEDPKKLLPPPVMLKPVSTPTLFTPTIEFEWEAREKAKSYYLEISTDWGFSILLHNKRVTGTQYEWQAPHKGVYYYRIYAIDADEFSGPYSEPFGLYVDLDTEPPYLSVKAPEDGTVLLSPEIVVQGTVEQQATLMVNEMPVTYNEQGEFTQSLTLTPGERIITITATDVAENTTTIQRRVVYNTTTQLITLSSPDQMILNTTQATITGELRPQTRVEINGRPIELPQQFEHVLTLPEGEHALTLKGISPEGDEQTLPLLITVDVTPPELRLEKVPTSTREPEIMLVGTVSEPVTLTLDGIALSDQDQRFEVPLTLQEGENTFVVEAIDRAGNTVAATLRTILDTTPPGITNVAYTPTETQGGEIITCEVNAEDAGIGLAKTGSVLFSVTPGEQIVKGILTFNRRKNVFEGSVFIPVGVAGMVAIQDVRVQDRLKNEATGF